MSRYVKLNMNPEHNDEPDCTIRAICLLLDKSWDAVYLEVCAEGFNMKRMPFTDKVWSSYLTKENCVRYRLPDTCPMCYTVFDFAMEHPKGQFLVKVDSHVVAVVDGYYYDTWDSGNETALYYWRKER